MFSKMIDSIIEVSKNTMQCLRLEMKIQPFNLESRVLTIFKWFQIMKWYKYWLHIDYSVCTILHCLTVNMCNFLAVKKEPWENQFY